MYKSLQEALISWHSQTTDRQKLQHAYIAVIVVLIISAGLIGLINYGLSQRLLFLVFVAGGLFIGNLVGWALLQSLVILPLEKLSKQRPSQKTRSKR